MSDRRPEALSEKTKNRISVIKRDAINDKNVWKTRTDPEDILWLIELLEKATDSSFPAASWDDDV